jgi:hypothetical protein
MLRFIRLTVKTGFMDADHVDDYELPNGWDTFTDERKESLLSNLAQEYLQDVCEAFGEVVEEDDE